MMRRLSYLPALLALAVAGCDSILDVDPPDQIPDEEAIVDSAGARAALVGAYDALQDDYYYGGDFVFAGELSSDNTVFIGVTGAYAELDANRVRADNVSIDGIWAAVYDGINRANTILARVPTAADLDTVERNDILGQALFLRALHYHNLVKLFGDVPLRLTPITTVEEAAQATRAPVDQVYAQIVSDLQSAETLITQEDVTTRATTGAAKALLARVYLYRQDWANAVVKADEVTELGYELVPDFSDLFPEDANDTAEDIFKVVFTPVEFNYFYYYWSCDEGGGCELAPSQSLIDAYLPNDERGQWSIFGDEEGEASGSKFPTTIGAEDFHVIRYAEIVLIKAEALAQQGLLAEAVAEYNEIRRRAGVPAHVLGRDVTTQHEVLDAIYAERQLEFAFEGDRWADLVRTGRAVPLLGIPDFQALYPIPQSEINVAPGLTQNPGY